MAITSFYTSYTHIAITSCNYSCILTGRFFLAIVIYFVAGMIIMRVKFDKTGSDVIPNKQFWFAIPFLVKVARIFICFMH